ncbi:unnamed protein product [Rodentolepis nana]|uniref:Histone H4 transcription factor n=1 Tax=Rodentolepis nana TaxID=102285 RepID=A0A0R3TUQ7_RODNA|nr:unnamed protein product [Rodentolepis nana]
MSTFRRQFRCTWNDCNVLFNEYNEFKQHMILHLEESLNSGSSDIKCGSCNIFLNRDGAAYRHVFFHSWLINLYLRGLAYQKQQDLPDCKLPGDHNFVPDFPTQFTCSWSRCRFQTNDVSAFYLHVSEHPQYYPGDDDEEYSCQWKGCSFSASRHTNIVAHLRSHTQEKVASCPQCGLLFTARNKLRDHIVRQYEPGDPALSPQREKFQCSYCLRCFGSRNIMLAHASRHVNKHICNICKLSLQSKSALERHVLYRHVNKAVVPCPHCPSKFKDVYCLRAHISRLHSADTQGNSTPTGSDCGLSTSLEPLRSVATPLGPLAAANSPNLGGSHLFPLQTSTPNVRRTSTSNNLPTPATTTEERNVFRCPIEGCRFYSTTQPGLLVHATRKHPPSQPQGSYACHVCSRRFVKGFLLSRHLITKHKYQRPAGHFKFNYVVCEDGLHRLQTLRLDTVEVASAILGPETVGEILPTGDEGNQIQGDIQLPQSTPLNNL